MDNINARAMVYGWEKCPYFLTLPLHSMHDIDKLEFKQDIPMTWTSNNMKEEICPHDMDILSNMKEAWNSSRISP